MKKIIFLVVLILLNLGLVVAQNATTDQNSQSLTKKSSVPVSYTCPMHHEINTDKPGKCPVCSMTLVQKASPLYVCPMHPVVTSTSPGNCPKCGMALVLNSQAYSCPMHPQITSAEPGKCTICGMKLQKTKAANTEMPMNHGSMQGHSM